MSHNDPILPLPGDYRELISSFLDLGYQVRNFSTVEPSEPHLVLRHDVDISIEHAHKLAQIEQKLGVHSSYFILLRNEFYNPFSKSNARWLKEIVSMGHEIGLHIDFSLYDGSTDTHHHHVMRESRILAEILEIPIYLVSFHRPSINMHGLDYDKIKLPGFVSAYDHRIFREVGFVSDSRGGWYHGHPLSHPAVMERRALQLLTHPIWWTTNNHGDAVGLLKQYSQASARVMLRNFYDGFRILREHDLED